MFSKFFVPTMLILPLVFTLPLPMNVSEDRVSGIDGCRTWQLSENCRQSGHERINHDEEKSHKKYYSNWEKGQSGGSLDSNERDGTKWEDEKFDLYNKDPVQNSRHRHDSEDDERVREWPEVQSKEGEHEYKPYPKEAKHDGDTYRYEKYHYHDKKHSHIRPKHEEHYSEVDSYSKHNKHQDNDESYSNHLEPEDYSYNHSTDVARKDNRERLGGVEEVRDASSDTDNKDDILSNLGLSSF